MNIAGQASSDNEQNANIKSNSTKGREFEALGLRRLWKTEPIHAKIPM